MIDGRLLVIGDGWWFIMMADHDDSWTMAVDSLEVTPGHRTFTGLLVGYSLAGAFSATPLGHDFRQANQPIHKPKCYRTSITHRDMYKCVPYIYIYTCKIYLNIHIMYKLKVLAVDHGCHGRPNDHLAQLPQGPPLATSVVIEYCWASWA